MNPKTLSVRKDFRYWSSWDFFVLDLQKAVSFNSTSNFSVSALISGGISSWSASAMTCRWSINSVIKSVPSKGDIDDRQKCWVSKPGILVATDMETTVWIETSWIDSDRSLIGVSSDSISKPAINFWRKSRNFGSNRPKETAKFNSLFKIPYFV